jgi:predicted ferric reductase
MDGTTNDFAATIEKWWSQPFSADMSVGKWALFILLVIVLIIAWNSVLKFILE